MEAPLEHTSTLILRAWLEEGLPDGLRVRILRTTGPAMAVTGADNVHAAVQAWLDELLEQSG